VAGGVEDRLTERGGSADVELHALPALRLLFSEGSFARVRAREIDVPLSVPNDPVLEQLDGFSEVDVEVSDARAGPIRLEQLTLRRDGDDRPYRFAVTGSVTARDLATFFGGFLGGLAGGAMPFGDDAVPIDLEAVVRSEDGRPRAVTVDGEVAGVPAGALVEALAQALAGLF
jgi:hypothetical protein